MLDGKMMMTEQLHFPDITYSETDSGISSGLMGFRRFSSTVPIQVQFGANFDGQTGALYLFNDNVSSASLRALYKVTAGTLRVAKREKMEEKRLDTVSNSETARTRASVVEITTVDAEEIAMTTTQSKHGSFLNAADATVVDVGDGEIQENATFPVELSYSCLGSKLFLAWDPRRTHCGVALDLHSGAHVTLDADTVQPWYIDGAKHVIGSIGGIQALLPIFDCLLCGAIEKQAVKLSSSFPSFDRRITFPLIPSLMVLLSSFLNEHDGNAREILRCGGIDILEHLLSSNRQNSNETGSEPATLMGALAVYRGLAELLIDSLINLRLVCSQYETLETTVFSRLFFNMPLWFGNAATSKGVALHAALLPLLASVTNANPKKARDCVGVRPLIESLRQYTTADDRVSSFS
jgi:hypothetical protein